MSGSQQPDGAQSGGATTAGPDPSMEDILASIRRILSEEEDPAAPPNPAAEPDVLLLDSSMLVPDQSARMPPPPPPILMPTSEPPRLEAGADETVLARPSATAVEAGEEAIFEEPEVVDEKPPMTAREQPGADALVTHDAESPATPLPYLVKTEPPIPAEAIPALEPSALETASLNEAAAALSPRTPASGAPDDSGPAVSAQFAMPGLPASPVLVAVPRPGQPARAAPFVPMPPEPSTGASPMPPGSTPDVPPATPPQPESPPMSASVSPAGLASAETANAAAGSVTNLVRALTSDRNAQVHNGGPTIADLVREEMRPMLKAWLDANLPPLVERLVRAEIERVIARASV